MRYAVAASQSKFFWILRAWLAPSLFNACQLPSCQLWKAGAEHIQQKFRCFRFYVALASGRGCLFWISNITIVQAKQQTTASIVRPVSCKAHWKSGETKADERVSYCAPFATR